MFVKICGVTSAVDALACADAGADAVGLNFWPRSKRHRPLAVLAEAARAVAGRVERFGVFVNPDPAEVDAAFDADLIDVAQLHGDEEPAFCDRWAGRYVKALRLDGPGDLEDLDAYSCVRFLVDAPSPGYGGAGQLMDEALARAACARAALVGHRVLLAGGLTADNVAAIASRVRPWGADVASGVELSPGVKDHDLIRRFVAAAKGR